MSDTGYYLAYPASDKLRDDAAELVESVRIDKPKKNPELLTSVLTLFTEESLDIYMLDIMDVTGLSGGRRKMIEMAANTIKKTTQSVLKRVVKKLDLTQTIAMAEYIDTTRLPLVRDNTHEVWYVAVPIEESLYNKIIAGHDLFREKGVDEAMPTLITNVRELIDHAMDFYIEKPLEILQLGPILNKIVRVALDTSLKLIHSTIDKVFAKLSQEEMEKTIEYFEVLLIEGPLHVSLK